MIMLTDVEEEYSSLPGPLVGISSAIRTRVFTIPR